MSSYEGLSAEMTKHQDQNKEKGGVFSHSIGLSVQLPAVGHYRSPKCVDIQKVTEQIHGRKKLYEEHTNMKLPTLVYAVPEPQTSGA